MLKYFVHTLFDGLVKSHFICHPRLRGNDGVMKIQGFYETIILKM